MLPLYLFAAILGGGLLLIGVLGGDADSLDTDAIDVDADVAGKDVGWKNILSLQTAAYALAAFGITGTLLSLTGADATLSLLAAGAMGVFGGGLAGFVFGWVRATQSGFGESSDTYIGGIGRTEVRIPAGGRGRIQLIHQGRMFTLPAVTRSGEIGREETVLVVDVVEGVAVVELAPRELTF
jgi:hypothetical protein